MSFVKDHTSVIDGASAKLSKQLDMVYTRTGIAFQPVREPPYKPYTTLVRTETRVAWPADWEVKISDRRASTEWKKEVRFQSSKKFSY